jgi:hypothetical protein
MAANILVIVPNLFFFFWIDFSTKALLCYTENIPYLNFVDMDSYDLKLSKIFLFPCTQYCMYCGSYNVTENIFKNFLCVH